MMNDSFGVVIMKIKYLLCSFNNGNPFHAHRFLSDYDDLELDPYDGRCGFAVGSNQIIIKEEEADPLWINLANEWENA